MTAKYQGITSLVYRCPMLSATTCRVKSTMMSQMKMRKRTMMVMVMVTKKKVKEKSMMKMEN